jgi:hypothetical protein
MPLTCIGIRIRQLQVLECVRRAIVTLWHQPKKKINFFGKLPKFGRSETLLGCDIDYNIVWQPRQILEEVYTCFFFAIKIV